MFILNTEHLLVSFDLLKHSIKAAERNALCVFVREPNACPVAIGRALNADTQGVVSRVSSVREAKQAIAASYSPLMTRGMIEEKIQA